MEYSKRGFNGSHHSRYGGLYYSIVSLKVVVLIFFLIYSSPVSAQTGQDFICSDFTYLGRYGSTSLFPRDEYFTLSAGYHRFMYVIIDVRQLYNPTINTFADFDPFDGSIEVRGIGQAENISSSTYVTNVFYVGNSSVTTVRVQSQFAVYDIHVSSCMPNFPTPTPLPTSTPFPTTTPGGGLFDCSEAEYPYQMFPSAPLLLEGINFTGTIEIRNNTSITVTIEVELSVSNSFDTYIIVPPYSLRTGSKIEGPDDGRRLMVVEPLSWPDGGIQYRIIPFNGCVDPIGSIDIIPTPVSSIGLQPDVRQVLFGVDFVSRTCYTIIQNYTFSQTFSIPFTDTSWDLSFSIPGLEICVRTYNAFLTYDDYDLISIVAYPLVITATLWAGFQILRD